MRMTPQELLEAAQRLNPEKYAADPNLAILDAYRVQEAIELAQEDVPEKQPSNPVTLADSNVEVEENLDPKAAVLRLSNFIERTGMKKSRIARELNVSVGSLSGWLLAKWNPGPSAVLTINKFLRRHGENQ